MIKIILVASGGAIGAVLRFFISKYTNLIAQGIFPWGTLAVNLIGCFLIGLLWAVSERVYLSPNTALFPFVGILGAFTTFSTYSLDSLRLVENGQIIYGLANIIVSNVAGLALVWVGKVLANSVLPSAIH